MAISSLLVIAGAVFAGTRVFNKTRSKQPAVETTRAPPDEATTDKTTAMALVSLGVASVGSLAKVPLVGMATLPVTLYVLSPALKHTWQKLRKERRVDDQALVSGRMAVYLVFNYPVIAALDATLYSYSKRYFLQRETQFRRKLLQQNLPAPVIEQMLEQSSETQRIGERYSDRTVPWMLATFTLTLPLLGPNLAAAFLTTNFGGHLRKLGPHTGNRFLAEALEQGVIVLHVDALEQLSNADIILIDESVVALEHGWANGQQWLQVLRNQYVAQYYLVSHQDKRVSDDLMNALGFDNCISSSEQAHTIQNLQQSGHRICVIDSLGDSDAVIGPVVLSTAELSDSLVCTDYVRMQLATGSLTQLPEVFALAKAFSAKQQFNLKAPILIDLVDISSTLLIDLGLVYSVLFTYSGLAVGVINSRISGNDHETASYPETNLKPIKTELIPETQSVN
ncbi:MAG: hypothetical protein ACPGSM_17260 [Thiolinea sp.]